jgi:hypothetical protein
MEFITLNTDFIYILGPISTFVLGFLVEKSPKFNLEELWNSVLNTFYSIGLY